MGEIATSERQITLFYNSNSSRAKQTLIYAKTEGLKLQEIDILKTPLTGTQIAEIANRLNIEVRDLVNQEHPEYAQHFEHHNFSSEDWIKMMQHNPEIINQPIALHGDKTLMISTPTDINKIL